jgi:CheY-like chemotaxis protein
VEAPSVDAPNDQSGIGIRKSPATESPRFERPLPAPRYQPLESALVDGHVAPEAAIDNVDDAAKLLVELLHRSGVSPDRKGRRRSDDKRLLLCVSPAMREPAAALLAENGYDVFVAENTPQALESMREERMDIVILDPQFDPVEQGFAFVTREVNILRPADRRRLFFVSLSPSARTFDLHSAFLNNVNLVVNPSDLEKLPRVLERALRDFHELYREFNAVPRTGAL